MGGLLIDWIVQGSLPRCSQSTVRRNLGVVQGSPIPKTSDTRRGRSRVAHHSEVCFVFGLAESLSFFAVLNGAYVTGSGIS